MNRKKNEKPYWEMTTEELREATKQFDEEFVFERSQTADSRDESIVGARQGQDPAH